MRLRSLVNQKKWIYIPVIITGIIFIYILVWFLFFPSHSLFPDLSSVDRAYLTLSEKFANFLLGVTGSNVSFFQHKVFLNHTLIPGFIPETLFKKWVFVLLFFFWITRAPFSRKIIFTLIVLISDFILISVYLAVGAHLAALGDVSRLFSPLSLTVGMLIMNTFGFLWFKLNKRNILIGLSGLGLNSHFFEKKAPVLFMVVYIYILLSAFALPYFEFGPWIHFLFTTSQKILEIFGYNVTVKPFLLIGDNGSIYMSKGCLGFKTLLLFATVVYLTGEGNLRKWSYILAGLIFLNIVNIIRFVLLFIHVQKYGGYKLAMDLHDMYNYITYTIVFILWVIWFEKFSDAESLRKDRVKK